MKKHAIGKSESDFLFSPRDSICEKWKRDHPNKPTPGTSRFHDFYTKDGYRQAVERAIERANREKPGSIQHWTPYQLRHASATFISLLFGIEQAAIQLGHARTATTRIYDHSAAEKAVRLVERRDAVCGDILEGFTGEIKSDNE